MFRKMRRFKQQITDEQCIEVLKNAKRGVLSLIGEDGYPYGLPINQWYCEEDGKLYFHGAKEGHKIDAIKACDKASFCTWDEGYRKEGDWALNIESQVGKKERIRVQSVYHWLDGKAVPSVDNLYALSVLFNVKLDDISEIM